MCNYWLDSIYEEKEEEEESDEEVLYDTRNKKEDAPSKKHMMIRCFACGSKEYAVYDEYGRFVCDACKEWEKKNLGGYSE